MLRVTCVAVAAVTAAFALASAAGGFGSATPSLARLLTRHVPVLVLHPAELFGPVAVEGFLTDSDLMQRTATGWVRAEGPLPSGGADYRLDQRLCRPIDGPAASPCYASAEAAHGSGPVVYGAAFRAKGRIDLQYWVWYPYDAYSPTLPAGETWQVHEGDWEAVSVVLDRWGKPLAAAYSQHDEGRRRDWANVPKRGVRPLVYVSLGSHANFFTPGQHVFDPRVVTPLLIEIMKQAGVPPVDRTGNGRLVRPRLVPVTRATPAWMTYAGAWGEGQYLHTPGGVPQAFGGSPRSPVFHEQWRDPVVEAMSWPKG